MAIVSRRRLAGFRFEAAPPALSQILPRMDITILVGFASAGPLHRPVAVENTDYFQSVFGDDVPLAWDPVRLEVKRSNLGPAVRSFFRNGGRRCWVVRVAASRPAARFQVPGLVRSRGAVEEPAWAHARSQGSWFDRFQVATALSAEGIEGLPLADGTGTSVRIRLPAGGKPVPGDLLRLTAGNPPAPWFLVVNLVIPPSADAKPGEHDVHEVFGTPLDPVPAQVVSMIPRIERLTFELHVRQGTGDLARLSGLGFAPAHPRYWNALPVDGKLFELPDWERVLREAKAESFTDLWRDAMEPRRFPLAGDGARDDVFLPRGMGAVPDLFERARISSDPALRRDGLDQFGSDLFVDPHLAGVGTDSVISEARFLLNRQAATMGTPAPSASLAETAPRLIGIHAALDIEEATLIAVPDAVQLGWHRTEVPLVSPPAFDPALPHASWALADSCDAGAPATTGVSPRWDRFLACDLKVIAPPILTVDGDPDATGTFQLSWDSPDTEVDFVLQEATRPDYSDAVEIHRGSDRNLTCRGRTPGRYYYRVLAEVAGETSNWSEGRVVTVAVAQGYEVTPDPASEGAILLDVHRALLRFCGARGDLFAVLALPETFRDDAALRFVARLTSRRRLTPGADNTRIQPLGEGEAGVLSFGAVYHPWWVGPEEMSGELQQVPPDGTACGMIARRTIERGAWMAPANEVYRGVIALLPAMDPDRQADLLEGQINLVRQTPGGFKTLSADTLSNTPELRPIGVRRLLILLRRAALRQGMDYVFETNGPALRRSVQRDFEALLDQLFLRGAFAGETRSGSFQVVTDETINTDEAGQRGQFRVDLRVAPALPLVFVTVRLEQWGEQGLVSEVF